VEHRGVEVVDVDGVFEDIVGEVAQAMAQVGTGFRFWGNGFLVAVLGCFRVSAAQLKESL
jgi:hypothetical protein